MKTTYRGFTLEVKIESGTTYYNAIRNEDNRLMVNLYSHGVLSEEPIIEQMKQDIDEYYFNRYKANFIITTEKLMGEWLNDFQGWLESRNETMGGTIEPYVTSRADDDF